MIENLVIVESPAKAKTIEKFLGKDFIVKSSFGHIRDLSKKNLGIDIENNYNPDYIVSDDKKNIVKELKDQAKKANCVWLASDEDREGEAIAWHLYKVLELKPEKTKRIVFHEITKDAIQNAIQNPRNIDENLVNAQQARRILDRLVGFELSPILWKKVKPSLSAGRVQSVAVRLLVEREREIMSFKSESSFKVSAIFKTKKGDDLKAELEDKIKLQKETLDFLEKCKTSTFKITDITKKPGKKSPAPPFTTSTLQQEASRKLGFSVAQTMAVAQRLYEAGRITYMRTDSVNLSGLAIGAAKKVILNEFGEKYLQTRNFKTKTKGAQEAHEAIRPTFFEHSTINGTDQERRLYELIWKRTIASQMSDALLEKTTITIDISNCNQNFIASGEVLKFDGFLKVYFESLDDENDDDIKGLLPVVNVNEELGYISINATQRFTHYPARYTEASLVKKLEELGIGRPSTYAPTISTIQNRGYVVKEDRPGLDRKYVVINLQKNKITEETKTEIAGAEKNKLFPNDIGIVVNDFLVDHFDEIISYNFTASVEEEFDEIAEGKMIWFKMIDKFYKPFHKKVDKTLETSARSVGERIIGTDPVTGKTVTVKIGPYGPMVQIGLKDEEEKPKFASLQRGQHIESITLEDALELFKLPRNIGAYENDEISVAVGRFGPYIKHNSKFYSLKKTDDPLKINLNRAIELIEEKRLKEKSRIIKIFSEDPKIQVLNGRWGAYISYNDSNFKIPKDKKPEELSYNDCKTIIETTQSSTKKIKKTGQNNKVVKKKAPAKKKTTSGKSKKVKK
ncbi:MAG: DNA topoisomerase I [Bacteroidetes bacterium GWC2_33_15]|nr:MAG: DNA topoisomerase I [Bacteroidetes bacterium GWA2_33_15]OFX51957.1 MAG: DNA topoisomerase I [Bacteroidetes bacterium GWC2_33_15]OFX63787.1 MAG: DNA topoisomerase I [Bacteroidetes bacterium GWB2_32_14]OFX67360.1 MAG: DNA topoisomerase I [Bacteroidetes bacterium GWD2_33_33]HAN17879.1 type I DNA topoisomerase [Bacteroidales bacterium]